MLVVEASRASTISSSLIFTLGRIRSVSRRFQSICALICSRRDSKGIPLFTRSFSSSSGLIPALDEIELIASSICASGMVIPSFFASFSCSFSSTIALRTAGLILPESLRYRRAWSLLWQEATCRSKIISGNGYIVHSCGDCGVF